VSDRNPSRCNQSTSRLLGSSHHECGGAVTAERVVRESADSAMCHLDVLTIVDPNVRYDVLPSQNPLSRNEANTQVGYDPYDSGLVRRPASKKRRDLRAVSKWIRVRTKPSD
jgi:hypothetical protein